MVATAVRGASRGWSECSRNEVVVLVREVLRVTAVHPTNCGGGNGRVPARPTKGASDATAATFGPEKVVVVQPVLPRTRVVLRWRG
jgi:hypothetical protein